MACDKEMISTELAAICMRYVPYDPMDHSATSGT